MLAGKTKPLIANVNPTIGGQHELSQLGGVLPEDVVEATYQCMRVASLAAMYMIAITTEQTLKPSAYDSEKRKVSSCSGRGEWISGWVKQSGQLLPRGKAACSQSDTGTYFLDRGSGKVFWSNCSCSSKGE